MQINIWRSKYHKKKAKRRQKRKQLPPAVYSDKHGGKTLIKEMDFKLDLFTLA